MTDRPIIMSTDSVKAILNDRKTQTRRIRKPQFPEGSLDIRALPVYESGRDIWMPLKGGGKVWFHSCPYGQVGDRLWVRETWAYINNYNIDGSENYYEYKADKPNDLYPGRWPADEARGNDEAPKWRSSRFMPKKASRITLEITEIRVERLQDISADDVKAEGCSWDFYKVWDSLNAKKYPWSSNPWVWVISFKKGQKDE